MDRISGLSDELLLKILLLVPTKRAVSTSILSKRWEYLWMSLPKLNYCHIHGSDPDCERLRRFLDRNLPLHRAPVIESLRLELYNSCFKPENINMWVLTALSHCVRELEILYEYYPPKLVILPSNLFTCKLLVILKLYGEILLDVPRVVSLPSLKTLKLQRMRYFNGETLRRLLSNCPVLEDLEVELRDYHEDDTRGKLTVAVPSLQSLSLCMPYGQDIDGYVIETPNLKYFKLRDHFRNDHYGLIENMPFLIEAYVDVVKLDDIKSLIGSITSVKRLSICSKVMCDEGFVFNQLEHLDVCICAAYFSNQLFWLLKASPNLQGLHLFFIEDDHEPYHPVEDWNQPSTVPECVLSSLQSLNWSFYTGKPQEKDIVVYILEHALHLKTATITTTESDVPKFEMLKELALSARASTTCKLMFE
ncbi:hypothetical protein Bca52824_000095 [Brassica carinata]|uniref:FBD domain-containing protein n=1 Tax=Brassica carinata TaxID=52824 RepID=A0A8X8BBC1_BRACI|nr:hypothetical protein Bca52824_000095 [Brassica carinata]